MTGPRQGPRSYALALASGGLLTFAFPEPDLAPIAWVALIPFLYVLRAGGARRRFGLGFAFGVAFFGTVLYWISIVGWLAWGVLVALQACFAGGFAVFYGKIAARSEFVRGTGDGLVLRVLAAPVLWVVFEFLRSRLPVGGFTWGELAQSQHNLPWILRYAGLGGGWLVAFAIVSFNALVLEAIERRGRGAGRMALCMGAAILVVAIPVAIPSATAGGEPVDVAIVQGNVPQKFFGTIVDKERAILTSHVALTEELAGDPPGLVVWPESSVGLDIDSFPGVGEAVRGAARTVGAPMIVGGNLDDPGGTYRVMAFEVSPDGEITDRYQKTHLVPFGEYVPFRGLFGRLPVVRDQVPRDARPGPVGVLFDVAGGAVAPVVSFEGDFGSLVQRRINLGGRLLVVATNTSTWNHSWASAQHLAFSQVRAAENGVWVVHAALSGISAFVSPDGRVVARTSLYEAETLRHAVRFADSVTLYARIGDWVPVACFLGGLLMVALTGGRPTRSASEEVTVSPDGT